MKRDTNDILTKRKCAILKDVIVFLKVEVVITIRQNDSLFQVLLYLSLAPVL